MKISIVIPCYNEGECIDKYYAAMQPVRKQLDTEFEYIFVDDGSTDNTLALVRALAAQNDEVRYVSFSRNFGKESAIYAGLQHATGDYVGLMDADLQDPPEMLLEMYKGVTQEGYDCVGCRRSDRKGESKIRSAFARMFYRLINRMSDVEIVDGARDYRLMSRKMTDAVLEIAERERFSKLTKYAVDGIEDFSTAPLKYNLALTIILLVAALAFAAFDIGWACGGGYVGALFIILPVVLFVASLLAFGLTVLGEYIKKIFKEVKARPVYLVRETEKDITVDNANIKITCDDADVIADAQEVDK